MRLSADVSSETVNLKTRDKLVTDHVGLVKALACRLAHRVPAQVELSELISVGVLGLIDAAGRYQPALGVPFDAFARRRIHGAMIDALRELDWVPRSVRKLRREVDATLGQLRHELRREPTEQEIASALDMSEAEYWRVLDQLRSVDLATIKRVTNDEGRDELEMAIDPDDGPLAHLERSELRTMLASAIAELPERERQILALYHHDELTLAEVGRVIGVGESRVSQLRTQAIARLRTSLGVTLKRRSAHARGPA